MQAHPYGAHEVMELHEVLNCAVDALNTVQLYAPYVRDPELAQLVQHQMQFMQNDYNNMVHMVQGLGAGETLPYRPNMQAPISPMTTPMPSVSQPNAFPAQVDDRDVSSTLLGLHKTGAKGKMAAALEAGHPQIRDLLLQGAVNCAHQAYEIWGYMQRRGYYAWAVMPQAMNAHLLRGYQPFYQAQAGHPAQSFAPPQQQPFSQPLQEEKGSISAQLAGGGAPAPAPSQQPMPVSNTPVNASHIFSSPTYRQELERTIETTSMTAEGLQAEGVDAMGAMSQQVEQPQSRSRKKATPPDSVLGQ
jgi:spore coat protein CotF